MIPPIEDGKVYERKQQHLACRLLYPKYVVSTTLTKAEWQNSTIISKNVVEEIQHLKEQSGQNILVAGSGKRLFPEGTEKYTFKLTETKAFETGVVVLHYQPQR